MGLTVAGDEGCDPVRTQTVRVVDSNLAVGLKIPSAASSKSLLSKSEYAKYLDTSHQGQNHADNSSCRPLVALKRK